MARKREPARAVGKRTWRRNRPVSPPFHTSLYRNRLDEDSEDDGVEAAVRRSESVLAIREAGAGAELRRHRSRRAETEKGGRRFRRSVRERRRSLVGATLSPSPISPFYLSPDKAYRTSYLSSPVSDRDRTEATIARETRTARIRKINNHNAEVAAAANKAASERDAARIKSLTFQRLRYHEGVSRTRPVVAADRLYFDGTSP